MSRPKKIDAPFEEIDAAQALTHWTERFGSSPKDFANWSFHQRGQVIWVTHKDTKIPEGLTPESVGMCLVRLKGKYPKPTTHAVMKFGHLATQNVVDLNEEEALRFMRRELLDFPLEDQTPGYVIARRGEVYLGCGLWIEGRLTSQIPKRWALYADQTPFVSREQARRAKRASAE